LLALILIRKIDDEEKDEIEVKERRRRKNMKIAHLNI
jgi:hypothetical protein